MIKTISLALILLLTIARGAIAGPNDPSPRLAPLTRVEFDAAHAEARRRARHEDPPGAPWEFLDRDKLARMLDMPEFSDISYESVEPLIDQAGAWDIFRVDTPSRAQAQWARMLPKRGIDAPVAERDRSAKQLDVYIVNEKWAKESGAQLALLHCLPAAAWRVHDIEPVIWAMRHEGGWRSSSGADFGTCVRTQQDYFGQHRDGRETVRGKASAEILENKLSAFLLAHGCSGKGPDSCTGLLVALTSLNRHHPLLPAIVKRIEADFVLDRRIVLPEGEPGNDAMDRARNAAFLRLIFLRAKLVTVLDHPEAWPSGELDQVLAQTLELDILMARGRRRDRGGDPLQDHGTVIARPWSFLPATASMPPAMTGTLMRLGRKTASETDCTLSYFLKDMPLVFWLGYAEVKLDREKTSCGVLGRASGAAMLYAQATGAPALIGGLRRFLDEPGAARDDVMTSLGSACDERSADPWKVCRDLAAKKAAALAVLQKEEADKAAAEALEQAVAAKDRLASQVCSEAMFEIAAGFLKEANLSPRSENNSIVDDSACKPWPGKEPYTLAVFTYDGPSDYEKRMLVALLDVGHGKVVASYRGLFTKDASVAYSDALRFDTARYQLKPGLRAFAIDVSTRSSRYAEGGFGPIRTLYVREGAKIRPVLDGVWMGEWHYADGYIPGDDNAGAPVPDPETVSSTIAIAGTVSHGYADLLITRKSSDPKEATTTQLLHYDGKRYPVSHR
jgi:hypothetical protein